MKPTGFGSAILVVLPLLAGQCEDQPAAARRCPELQQSFKLTLLEQVRARYRLAATAAVTLTEDTLVQGTCYHKLTYQVQTQERSFPVPLYLSPDQHFLSYGLFEVQPPARPNSVATRLSAGTACSEPEARAAGPKGSLTDGALVSQGSASAPVTVVIFSDFQCPYCKKAAAWLRAEMGEFGPGKLRVVFRNFPLSFHAWAQPAAQAAACVGLQNQSAFWQFHDSIFANQISINAASVQSKMLEYAQSIPGLDLAVYKRCVETGQSADAIKKDQSLGASYQVRGTPSVFVNGQRLPGLRSGEQLHAAIEQALRNRETVATAVGSRE